MRAPQRPERSLPSPRALFLSLALASGTLACAPTPASDDEAAPADDTESSDSEDSDTDESTTDDTDDGRSFIDDHSPQQPVECDNWDQDCPEGEKCVPYAFEEQSWNATKCVPVLGDRPPGQSCALDSLAEGTDDCDEQGYCFFVDDNQKGTCQAFCQGNPDAPECAEGTTCSIANQGTINLCIQACHPLEFDCPEGFACAWNTDFMCLPHADPLPELGQPCSPGYQCAEDLFCVGANVLPACDDLYCCTDLCELDDPNAECALPGTACTAPDPLIEGYENVGYCLAQ